jgi:hypothetical protein
MVCPPRINNHAIQTPRLVQDLIHGLLYAFLLGDICLHGEDPAGVPLGERGEVVAGGGDVDAVDLGGVVCETAFGDAEADAPVCAGD